MFWSVSRKERTEQRGRWWGVRTGVRWRIAGLGHWTLTLGLSTVWVETPCSTHNSHCSRGHSLINHPHISYTMGLGLGVRSFGSSAAAGEKEIVKLCFSEKWSESKVIVPEFLLLSCVLMLGMETMILQRSYRLWIVILHLKGETEAVFNSEEKCFC